MISSKDRAYLKRIISTESPVYQVGKDGLSQTNIEGINQALTARELIKIHVLENSLLDTKATCNEVAERLSAEPVQAIGSKFVIFRPARKTQERKIILPKK